MLVDLDFETASAADLKTVGAWAYAEDPTTEILCLVSEIEGDNLVGNGIWRPGQCTHELCTLALDPGVVFVAHNAGFEQAIWHHIMVPVFGLPPLPPERWEDTMATCALKALPLKLEQAALALKLPLTKDMEGNRLTLGMSRINKKTGMYPRRTAETLGRIADYCAQDVAVEGALRKRIGLLSQQSPHERGIWLLDQKINQRGVRIDFDFVRQAQLVVDRATVPLLAEFRDLTSGVNPGQVAKVIAWAGEQGVPLANLQKGYLDDLLGAEEDPDDSGCMSSVDEDQEADAGELDLPLAVRRVLEIRQMLGSASIKKLARMRACVSGDGRARGLLQYHAAGTGRWGGRLLQPQNFPRGTLKDEDGHAPDPEIVVAAIMTGDPDEVETLLGAPAIECVASSLRHALIPGRGKRFLVGDFAGIEARIVLALAGQHDKTALIAGGQNPYFDFGQLMFGHAIDRNNLAEYIPAKAGVLGCGFSCGAANFNNKFLGGTQLDLAEQVVHTYRKEWAPKVPQLWYGLNDAARKTVHNGAITEAYGVTYRHEGEWLTAQLPSEWQKLWYHRPRVLSREEFIVQRRLRDPTFQLSSAYRDDMPWEYSAYKGGKLSHVNSYGGLLTENAVQGLARGLLAASMMRLEREGMPIVLTVHDEVVCEVDEAAADLGRFERLMAEPTIWSDRIGVPIAVETWSGTRYRK